MKKKLPPPTKNMYSPDLFSPKSRINVYSIRTGLLVGSITKKKNGQLIAQKVDGVELIFTDEEAAKSYLRDEVISPISFEEENTQQLTNPNQVSLF